MTLKELLKETGDSCGQYGLGTPESPLIVIPDDKNRSKYFQLSDYYVSSSISGPGLVMIKKEIKKLSNIQP